MIVAYMSSAIRRDLEIMPADMARLAHVTYLLKSILAPRGEIFFKSLNLYLVLRSLTKTMTQVMHVTLLLVTNQTYLFVRHV